MQISQTKHTVPVRDTDPLLITSGMSKNLAWFISNDFAFKAKKDGYVEKIDYETKFVYLKYDDETTDVIDIDDVIVKNGGGGFYLRNVFKVVFDEGERFKRNDIIAYNPSYFSGKGTDVDYNPGTLAKVAISPGDWSYEDACFISESLSDKMTAGITMTKPVSLGPNATIHKIVDVGDVVRTGDSLIEFTASFDDPETNAYLDSLFDKFEDIDLSDLNSVEKISTKYTGKVVDIKIHYNVDKEELSPTLLKLLNRYSRRVNARRKAVQNYNTDSIVLPILEKTDATKINGKYFEGVLIEFFVEYEDKLTEGDKITFSTALKGVISKRVPEDESPISEFRQDEIVEAILSPTSVISRMVPDVYGQLWINKVLIELKRKVKEIYEK